MIFDQSDVESVALCATKEARGDGLAACIAVMWVISNRAWNWEKSIHDIVYAKNQFSSMSVPSDPEFNWSPTAHADVEIYRACLAAAPDALNRIGLDPTGMSHYYARLDQIPQDGWFWKNIKADGTNHPEKAVFGKQTFFL